MLARNKFDETIRETLEQYDFNNNIFFIQLKNGEMSKEEFLRTQEQFYHAVVHFTSPLALVAGSIPTYQERVNIIKNLWEEHGEGNMGLTHGETFIELMRRLTGKKDPQIPRPEEAVLLFNETLSGICRQSQFLRGVALIGIIERMFADISSFIGSSIVEREWLTRDNVIHYSLHEELDCIHAEDFFRILRPYYDNEEKKEVIDEGLRLGALTFLQLYRNLYEQAKKS